MTTLSNNPLTTCKKSTEGRLKKCSWFRDEKGQFHWFLFWNLIAALAHLGNAIASYVEATEIGRTNMYPVFQDYTEWRKKTDFCADSCSENATGYTRMDYVILPTESKKSSELSLFWLIIGFHLLSFGFQIGLNTDYLRNMYVRNVLTKGVNPIRFVEYSISASIMVLCLALISNILNLYALIALGCLTTVTQLFGLLAECLFSDEFLIKDKQKCRAIPDSGDFIEKATFRQTEVGGVSVLKRTLLGKRAKFRTKLPLSSKLRRLGWVAHFSGWISMLAAYIGILVQQYFWSVSINKDTNNVSPPDWVNILIIVLAVLYNIFGFTQIFQLCAKDPYLNTWTGGKTRCPCVTDLDNSGDGKKIKCCGASLNEAIELCYVLNSLTSKSVLGWSIIGNLLREDTVISTTVTCP